MKMRFKVNKKTMTDAINSVGHIANAKNVVPILQCVKIEIRKDGFIVISASDNDISAMRKFKIDDTFDDDFSFCIDPRDLSKVLSSIKEEEIELSIDKTSCNIKHIKGDITLPVLDSSLFYIVEKEKGTSDIKISSDLLTCWLKNAIVFVSNDSLRPVMTGVYLYVQNGEFGVCSTDGQIMFTDYVNEDEYKGNTVNAILSAKSVSSIISIIDNNESVTISFGENKVTFRTGTSMLTAVKCNGNFPNFKSIIRKESPIKVTIDKNELLESIYRSSLSANKNTTLIRLNVDGMSLKIDSEDIDFSKKGHEEILCESQGDNIEIGINGDKMIKCLKSVYYDKVTLEMKKADNAINIIEKEYPNKVILIMPIMIN